jgi:hypothetical protein
MVFLILLLVEPERSRSGSMQIITDPVPDPAGPKTYGSGETVTYHSDSFHAESDPCLLLLIWGQDLKLKLNRIRI